VTIDWAAARTRSTAAGPAALVLASAGTRPRGAGLAGYVALARAIGRLPDRGLGLHTFLAGRVLGAEQVADLMAGGVALPAMVPTLQAVGGIDVLAALAGIECPIWFVNGRLDHFRAEERLLLRAARHATLQLIPRAGHLVALDQPDAFSEVLMDVIEHVEPRTARP
jgi:pimeloyl-ACP methyl ester carboxylesterase